MAIDEDGDGYRVVVTGERADVVDERSFAGESDALDAFLDRARAQHAARRRRREEAAAQLAWRRTLTRPMVAQLLRDEAVEGVNFFEDRPDRPDEVGIQVDGDRWRIYATASDGRVWLDLRNVEEGLALGEFLTRARLPRG